MNSAQAIVFACIAFWFGFNTGIQWNKEYDGNIHIVGIIALFTFLIAVFISIIMFGGVVAAGIVNIK